jgi:beta-lactamase regulating signal transducer with metallopeptidase domain
MPGVFLSQIALKGALVLMTTWALTYTMRRGSAAARHLVWTIGIVATCALPVVRLAGPSWTISVPATSWAGDALSTASPPAMMPLSPGATLSVAVPARDEQIPAFGASPLSSVSSSPEPVEPAASAPADTRRSGLTFWNVAFTVWLAGALLMLLRLAYGLDRAGRIARKAVPVTNVAWLSTLDAVAASLGVTREVRLRRTDESAVPVVCGLWHASILLPADAHTWSADRRRLVLLHELAHVQRRDCLVQALAQFTCAIHWFNPLAHLALARLRAEQERACDDMVLAAGADAPAYADHLFEIARAFRTPGAPAWTTVAMARPSQLEGRLMAILDDRCNRAPLVGRRRATAAVVAAVGLLALGTLRLTAASGGGAAALSTTPDTFPHTHVASHGRNVDASDARALAPVALTRETSVIDTALPLVVNRLLLPLMSAVGEGLQQAVPPPAPVEPPAPATPPAVATPPRPAELPRPPDPDRPVVSDETRRRVADALATALTDENDSVREQALNGLLAMRDPRVIPSLLTALRDPNADLRERAVSGLAQFSTLEALDGVVSAMKDSSADVREQAIRAVGVQIARGRLDVATYTGTFIGLLRDAEPDIREAAASALGQARATAAVSALTALLKDPEKEVRESAARALGQIGDPAAIDALTAALKDMDPDVRERAASALARIAGGRNRVGPPTPRLNVPVVKFDSDAQKQFEKALEASMREVGRTFDGAFDKGFDEVFDKAFDDAVRKGFGKDAQREFSRSIQDWVESVAGAARP